MTPKMIEIRDEGTFIPALAVRLDPGCDAERWLLDRAGFGRTREDQKRYILLVNLAGGLRGAQYEPVAWGGRTMPTAHRYLEAHFDEVSTGQVIDVEHILGETPAPKRSEREDHP